MEQQIIKSDLNVPIDEFFQDLDSAFSGLKKIEDEEFVYKSTDVLVQSNLEVPIIVQWPESKVSFEFYSKLGSVVFYVVFVAAPADGCEVTEECVITLLRPEKYGSYDEPITGEFVPPCEGVLFFIWDNAHDWLSVKKITYNIQVHQPSFSLIDSIRTEKARDLLPHTIDELNHDYDLREDMKNAARNNSSSVAFLSLQIKQLQDRLDEKKRDISLIEQEEQAFQNIIDLNNTMRDGLHMRCLSKPLLLHIFAYLFDFESNNIFECQNVCTHWASLCGLLQENRTNINGFLNDLLFQERQSRVILLPNEQKQLVQGLKQQSLLASAVHRVSGTPLSSTTWMTTELSACSDVPHDTTDITNKSQKKTNPRIIRVPSTDHHVMDSNLLQRSLSRARSRSLSTVSCASSISPVPPQDSSKLKSNNNVSFKIVNSRKQTTRKNRSSSSHSSDSDKSSKSYDNIHIRTGRQPHNPSNVHTTPNKDANNNSNNNTDTAVLAQVTKKMELLLSPDPLPARTTNNMKNETNNQSQKKRKIKCEKKTLDDSLSSSDEENEFDILPTIRKVVFGVNDSTQPLQPQLTVDQNTTSAPDKDVKEEEDQRPSLTRHHSHSKHHRSHNNFHPSATNNNNGHRRRSSHTPIPVPEELKGKIVSLKDVSKLLPSLTSHPHLQTPSVPAPANKNNSSALPIQNNTALMQTNIERRGKQQRQVFEFISQANQQMFTLYREKRELKRLIRSWHHMQADMSGMLEFAEENDQITNKNNNNINNDKREIEAIEIQASQSMRNKHGELVSLHEKYRQVSLHLRICNERLAMFLKRLSSHPELLQQALQQLSQVKYVSAVINSEDNNDALEVNISAKSGTNKSRRNYSKRRLSENENK